MKGFKQTLVMACLLMPSMASASWCRYDKLDDISEVDKGSYSLYIDQDVFMPKSNEDRDYTMGMEFSVTGDWVLKNSVYCGLGKILKKINSLYSDYDNRNEKNFYHSGSIGFTAFTPDDLSNPDPILNDRPYANLFYLSVSEHMVTEEEDHATAITSRFVLGVLGLDLGRDIQTAIHKKTGSTLPEGWDHQISDGGELTALYYRRSMRNYIREGEVSWSQPEIVTYWDYSLGYYVEAGAGMRFRFGRVVSPFYLHMSDPMLTGNHAATRQGDSYWFIDLGYRYNVYNAMLQGQTKKSDVTFDYDEIEHGFAQLVTGYVYAWKRHSISLVVHGRGSEFKSGPADRDHYFGGLYYSYRSE